MIRKKYLKNFDWISFLAMIFLFFFGLLAIFSTSLEQEKIWPSNFHKQLIFLFVGLILFFFITGIDYLFLMNYSKIMYLAGIILMIAVLLFGKEIRGTVGWFSFGFFNLQPVEIMKVFLIISLSKFFAVNFNKPINFWIVLKSFFYLFLPVFLTILQPDFGSALVMIVIWIGLLWAAGLKSRYFVLIFILFAVFFGVGWQYFFKEYQKQRILTFINPENDPLGSGYNVIQSMIAIGSGGFLGKGIGRGSQSQLNFLPEKHTDFIFASIAEEIGFWGIAIILSLFFILGVRFFQVFKKSKDIFGKFLMIAISTMIFFHIFVNIGMNLGIMPVTGLSLPFLSYGGSFTLSILILMGIVQAIWKKEKKEI